MVYGIFFFSALILGTLAEYVFHRFLLHSKSKFYWTRNHRLHHKTNIPDPFWGELVFFSTGTLPFIWIGFLYDWVAGLTFIGGGLTYVLLLTVVHQLCHRAPQYVFWLNPNAHRVHHEHSENANKYNFGIVTYFWDRVFGTYKIQEENANLEKPL